MNATEEQRRAICEELGLDYEMTCSSGRCLTMIDRLILLRAAMAEMSLYLQQTLVEIRGIQ
jgi:hypothetical protein